MTVNKLIKNQCYINGQWVTASSQETIQVHNPFDASIVGHVPHCGAAESTKAIEAAHAAQSKWRNLTAKDRSDILLKWFDLINQHCDELAQIMTLEQGKPLQEAINEINYANGFIRWFAEEGRRVYGDMIPANNLQQNLFVLKQPIGVVAAITPWNFPAAMVTRKIAPALAVGCTIVVKPDSETPLTALALAALAEQANIPAGVFNVLTGDSKTLGEVMTSHPLVRKLSFTGSTKVGQLLMKQCASTIKKVSFELGGNAPFIVFDDADIEAAVKGALASKFRNSGQTCVCANRFYVQETIHDEFVEKFSAEVKKLKLGNGLDSATTQGPLINKKALEKVMQHVQDAINKGAQLICGGKPSPAGELFFEPTVLTEVNNTMQLSREETFGPVAAIFKFKTEEDVITLANDTEFGLAAYFYSESNSRIWRVATALETGIVGVNTGIISTEVAPFGGVKQSGIGREGSKYGVDDYLEIKYICMQM